MSHDPPGTSKWNKLEHRLFSFISGNWRGQPLSDMHTIVELIGVTTTEAGLVVCADYDDTWYAKGIKITKDQQAEIPITSHDWQGEWNYTIATSIQR